MEMQRENETIVLMAGYQEKIERKIKGCLKWPHLEFELSTSTSLSEKVTAIPCTYPFPVHVAKLIIIKHKMT